MSKRTLQAESEGEEEEEEDEEEEAFRKLCLEIASRRSVRVARAKVKTEALVGAKTLEIEEDTTSKSKKQKKQQASDDILETIIVASNYTRLTDNAAAQKSDTTSGNTIPNTKFDFAGSTPPSSSTRRSAGYSAFRTPTALATAADPMTPGSSDALPDSSRAPASSLMSAPPSALSPSVLITVNNILTTITHSYHGLCLHVMPTSQLEIPSSSLPYAEAINRSPLLADKLMAFRARGPSFSAISSILLPHPTPVTPIFVIRWMTMRFLGFGRPELIESLASINTPADVLDEREKYKNAKGAGINTLPAYGNVCFDPKRVPGYIEKIFQKGHILSSFLAIKKTTFRATMEKIKEMQVPYHSDGTIFQWLLACDLAEVGLIHPPTARDLAVRLWTCGFKGKGGKGAWDGFLKGIDKTQFGDVDDVERYLMEVYEGVKGKLQTDMASWGGEDIFREEGFWYSDLEHCLCKVIRAEKYATSLSHE